MAIGLGWKKFSFFEQDDRPGVAIPEETTCCSGSAYHIAFGCSGGQVCCCDNAPHRSLAEEESGNLSACVLLKMEDLLQVVLYERGFTGQLAFQAHGNQVSQLICLKVTSTVLLHAYAGMRAESCSMS